LCLAFEGVVFGMAAILFIQSFITLRRFTGNLVLVISNPLLFLFATLHIIGVAARTYRAFITSGDPHAYYKELTNAETVVAESGQFGAILVSDLLSVYRVWTVLRSAKWRTIIPAVGCAATFVLATIEIQFQRLHESPEQHNFFEPKIFALTLSYLVASLFTTAASTGLIVWDLLSADMKMHRQGGDDDDGEGASHPMKQSLPMKAARIFVESAALYSIVNLLWMAWFASRSLPESIFSTLGPSTSSITFSLITLRLVDAVTGRPTPRSSRHRMSNLGGTNINSHHSGTLTYGDVGSFSGE